MVGNTRRRGTSSSTPQQDNGEDEEVEELEAGSGMCSISPGGLWFESKDVVKHVSGAIKAHYETFCPNWKSTPPHVRELWWRYFKNMVKYNSKIEAEVKEAFFDKCQYRLKDMMYRASKCKESPKWMKGSTHKLLLARKKDSKFTKNSITAKANRIKHAVDGKALGTHTMGCISALKQAERMAMSNTEGKLPSALNLFVRSKTAKGGIMTPKAKNVLVRFESKKTQLQEEGAVIKEDEIFYDVVGGRKKGKVYGVGSAAPVYFGSQNFTSSKDSPTKRYSPGLVSKLEEQNMELSKRLGEVEQWKEDVMILLTKQFGEGSINPTCHPNIKPGPKDLDGDGGSGADTALPVV